jgi:enterobactin synthetase component D
VRLTNPEIFPRFVAQFSIDAAQASIDMLSQLMPQLVMPPRLQTAVRSRQLDFIAGRYCARQALRRLAPSLAEQVITMSDFGVPGWPSGIAGSITHTSGFVAAAVAFRRDALGLGIDAEQIMNITVAEDISEMVASAKELALVERTSQFSFGEMVTFIYSAKEALFKCLYPVVGAYFDFLDLEIMEVDVTIRQFRARLLTGISPVFRPGFPLRGRFDVAYGCVHTGVVLGHPAVSYSPL